MQAHLQAIQSMPVIMAVVAGNLPLLRAALRQHPTEVNRAGPEGITALLVAIANGDEVCVRALLAAGADFW